MQSGLTPYNEATRDVIAELSGVRSPERIVAEFFGLSAEELANPASGVRWHPRLAELGVDERAYADITGHSANEPAPVKERLTRRKKDRPTA